MSKAIIREALDMLLQEAYDGPPDHHRTWFVSTTPDSSLLGTTRHLTAEQAWLRPHGVAHSVAEHVAHLIVSIDVAMKYANGEKPEVDWEQSWECGTADDGRWHTMQRTLREHHLRMRMMVHAGEPFEGKEALAGFIASVAHAAYHLGAIRQLAAIILHEEGLRRQVAHAEPPLGA